MASLPTSKSDRSVIGGAAVPRFSWKTSLAILVFLAATGWSVAGTNFDPIELVTSTEPVRHFVSGMFPPDFSAATLRTTLTGVLETLQMSFLGALIGALVGFPLAALGTQKEATVGASRGRRLARAILYHAARILTNVFRSVPDILWALVFVVALGLGPFPGTLALAVHSAGILVVLAVDRFSALVRLRLTN